MSQQLPEKTEEKSDAHPFAALTIAIGELREELHELRKEIRHLGSRTARVEEKQEASYRKAEHAMTVASGASRRVSEVEAQTKDVHTAMTIHVDKFAKVSKDLTDSNTKQNKELDKQTDILVSIKKWTPVIAAIFTLVGTALGSGISAYVHAKMNAPIITQAVHEGVKEAKP